MALPIFHVKQHKIPTYNELTYLMPTAIIITLSARLGKGM
jgi:hypothetical protein